MLHTACIKHRQAVALFTFKSFRARQKIALTPASVASVFAEQLDSQDRLLRQSSVGSGASRFLVLDKQQRVRGVYHPLLCLPYPLEGAGVLGTPVDAYLHRLRQRWDALGDFDGDACTFVVVSYANGLGVTAYGVDGSVRLPLVNVKLPARRHSGVGMMNERDMRPFAETTSLVDDFAEVVAEHYATCIHPCSSFFFLSSANAALSLGDMRVAWRERGLADTSPLSLDDRRWVTLPDVVVQHGRATPLYCRDDEGDKVASAKGLEVGVKVGLLELDT
ncbi:hypothetical protein DQ04_00231140 [Trypanosoma grayi]|uniref:hypothetical protein n=1 Tax=Trypanosoma grayi TaxID=71804 RepID=UPI0004F45078|nr:hypothetical protein DQ04_00231140 [Trypanosoma grayi]KEG14988.1 hypothetical protein DQ04_00231140 [Trypanosoma grayi]